MLRFSMIAVDFLLMEHKIHRDHEKAVQARVLLGPDDVGPAPSCLAHLHPLAARSAGRVARRERAVKHTPTPFTAAQGCCSLISPRSTAHPREARENVTTTGETGREDSGQLLSERVAGGILPRVLTTFDMVAIFVAIVLFTRGSRARDRSTCGRTRRSGHSGAFSPAFAPGGPVCL